MQIWSCTQLSSERVLHPRNIIWTSSAAASWSGSSEIPRSQDPEKSNPMIFGDLRKPIKMAQHARNSESQSGPKGSKWSLIINLTVFASWKQVEPIWTISDKSWFSAPNHFGQAALWFVFKQKINFHPKWPMRDQMGSARSQITILECCHAGHVWEFLVQKGPFLGHLQPLNRIFVVQCTMCTL